MSRHAAPATCTKAYHVRIRTHNGIKSVACHHMYVVYITDYPIRLVVHVLRHVVYTVPASQDNDASSWGYNKQLGLLFLLVVEPNCWRLSCRVMCSNARLPGPPAKPAVHYSPPRPRGARMLDEAARGTKNCTCGRVKDKSSRSKAISARIYVRAA